MAEAVVNKFVGAKEVDNMVKKFNLFFLKVLIHFHIKSNLGMLFN
jgi:hypothetical protein